MTKITGQISIIIQAPAHDVYEYVLDFTRHPEWVANLSKVTKQSNGPIGVGSLFRASEGPPPLSLGQKAKMMFFFMVGMAAMGVKPFSESRITALEPDRRIVWQAWLPRREGNYNQAEWEITFEPQNGSTRLTQRFGYQPQLWAARQMVGPAEDIEQACAVNLANLKAVLEEKQRWPASSR